MDKGKKIFLTLMIVFALSTIALSVATGVLKQSEKKGNNELEAHYQQAFFELLQQTNDMEVKLAKVLVSTSNFSQGQLLCDVWKGSEVCATALAALSARDGSVQEAMKFENQLGDYSYYQAGKLFLGEGLDEEAYQSFKKLHETLKLLGENLAKVQTEMNDGYLFIKDFGGENDILSGVLRELNGGSVEYPKLIYDGPFSDSRQQHKSKFLFGQPVSADLALSSVKKYTAYYKVKSIDYLGLWKGDVPTHAFEIQTELGQKMTAQITEQGGYLYSLTMAAEVTEPALTETECVVLAEQYLTSVGFFDMTAVWSANSNSVVYVNFAPTQNGVILYSDLIKVKVRSDSGEVVGVEANNYLLNHTKRELDVSAVKSESEARSSLSERLTPSGAGRLTLIPDGSGERLCYEYACSYEGEYYIYVDAITLEEAKILFVIDSDGGKLLM